MTGFHQSRRSSPRTPRARLTTPREGCPEHSNALKVPVGQYAFNQQYSQKREALRPHPDILATTCSMWSSFLLFERVCEDLVPASSGPEGFCAQKTKLRSDPLRKRLLRRGKGAVHEHLSSLRSELRHELKGTPTSVNEVAHKLIAS